MGTSGCVWGHVLPYPCAASLPLSPARRSLSQLNTLDGTMAATPLGNIHVNPCNPAKACANDFPGSLCCLQMNGTSGSKRWVGCGTESKAAVVGATAPAGIMIDKGNPCGYVFAPAGMTVSVSIAFQCDKRATGAGIVSADPTAFLRPPGAPPGGRAPPPGAPTQPCHTFPASAAADACDPRAAPPLHSHPASSSGGWARLSGRSRRAAL
jgi:hypothetical protein